MSCQHCGLQPCSCWPAEVTVREAEMLMRSMLEALMAGGISPDVAVRMFNEAAERACSRVRVSLAPKATD